MSKLARSIQLDPGDKLTVTNVARALGVTRQTVYNWLKRRDLVNFTIEDLRYFVKKRKMKPRGRPFEEGYDPRRYDLQARKDG
jgi:DNA invertase Pin-like site-specific DNA recombinase